MNYDILNELFDTNTFVQTNSYVVSALTDNSEAGDGVITGYGSVEGRAVFAAIQDESVLKGSVGVTHAQKICSCIEMAVKAGSPFVFFVDSAGARINEGLDVLGGYGKIIKSLSAAIGEIPTIAVITGKCTGASSLIASMVDFTVMTDDGYFAFSGVDSLAATTLKDVKTLGSAKGAAATGKVSLTASNRAESFILIKDLLSYLPDNCECCCAEIESNDDFNRAINASSFDTFSNYDVRELIVQIADNGKFFELSKDFAPNAVTGFAHVGNKTVCFIANQPSVENGLITTNACNKISAVLAFCDKFSIPVITLTNTCGFAVSVDEETAGISAAAALLATSYANSEITKINIITGKAYGSAYLVMNGKNTGADIVYAWDKADISVITPEAGALLLYNNEIKASSDPVAAREEYINKYRMENSSPMQAAYKGLVDDVIPSSQTRARIISALYLLD